MSHLNVLIKPASSFCNMRCKYCFYFDESEGRDIKSYGFMKDDVLIKTIQKALDGSYSQVSFLFQGGEPTLCGLDFFKKVIALEKKFNIHNVVVSNSLQTNGYRLSTELLDFFKQENFLLGISLDGIKETHDKVRGFATKGTFDEVYKTLKYAQNIKLPFTVLTVVTEDIVNNLDKIYAFYKQEGFFNLHFIPCLKPIFSEHKIDDYSLDNDYYQKFLFKIFNLWYEDVKNGFYLSIRHIDNYLMLLMQGRCESCAMQGKCSIQYVVEGNGNVYPCDFYATDKYFLGNIKDKSFKELSQSANALAFVNESLVLQEQCSKCSVFKYCRNGCKRDRIFEKGQFKQNMYCKAYNSFLTENLDKLADALRLLTQR